MIALTTYLLPIISNWNDLQVVIIINDIFYIFKWSLFYSY